MEKVIKEKLAHIEADYDVRILWAIESGSHSWGFVSPDSDYDVRFLYVNKPDWNLSIEEDRDVIELPIDDEMDISGWNLRKRMAGNNYSRYVEMESIKETNTRQTCRLGA